MAVTARIRSLIAMRDLRSPSKHPADYDRWLTAEHAHACALATAFPSQLMRVA